MPISLRLPADVERQIAGYSARHGVSKSAVIVRSISEFLANHTQPSSFQIYEEAMCEERNQRDDVKREAAEQRPHKIKAREAIRGIESESPTDISRSDRRARFTARVGREGAAFPVQSAGSTFCVER